LLYSEELLNSFSINFVVFIFLFLSSSVFHFEMMKNLMFILLLNYLSIKENYKVNKSEKKSQIKY
jgi:hypothetical protein